MDKLEEVREEFEQEKQQLITDLQSHVRTVMGDTPINLNSPEQLSWVIYGRKVIDKQDWATLIDPYMNDAEFRQLVATGTQRIQHECSAVSGTVTVLVIYARLRRMVSHFAKPSKCLLVVRQASSSSLQTNRQASSSSHHQLSGHQPMAFY